MSAIDDIGATFELMHSELKSAQGGQFTLTLRAHSDHSVRKTIANSRRLGGIFRDGQNHVFVEFGSPSYETGQSISVYLQRIFVANEAKVCLRIDEIRFLHTQVDEGFGELEYFQWDVSLMGPYSSLLLPYLTDGKRPMLFGTRTMRSGNIDNDYIISIDYIFSSKRLDFKNGNTIKVGHEMKPINPELDTGETNHISIITPLSRYDEQDVAAAHARVIDLATKAAVQILEED